MKKIIGFLFALQLVIVALYGLYYLRNLEFYETFLEDRSMMLLNFDDNFENYEFFLELMEEKGLTVSQLMRPNAETIMVFTSDVTSDGRFSLLEGHFPHIGTAEFISTLETEDIEQVGLMENLIHDINIIVAPMDQAQNFGLDGIYYINTTDALVLETIIEVLNSRRLPLVHLFDDIPANRIIRVLGSVYILEAPSAATMLMIREFIFIFPVMILCLLVSIIQYALGKIKSATIFAIHGYDRKRILKEITFDLVPILFYSTSVVLTGAIFYIVLTDRTLLFLNFTIYYLMFSFFAILFYTLLANAIVLLLMLSSNTMGILKGRKIKLRIQGVNHVIKFVFVIVCIFQFTDMITELRAFLPRIEALQYWEQAEGVYRITANLHSLSDFTRYDEQKIAFYHDLVTYHHGFIMDSGRISWGDSCDAEPEWCDNRHLLDGSNEITINTNFLRLNPIYDFDGNPVYDQLIRHDNTLNVLLPERFFDNEIEIYDVFLEKVTHWNRVSPTSTSEEMSVNIIHVPDGQYYFSFDPLLRIEEGHRIRDPIANVYDGVVTDALFIPSILTHSLYFISESNQPFSDIESLVYEHGLTSEIQRVEAVYEQHLDRIYSIRAHYIRSIGLIALLIVANIAVTYSLVANYFERYKFDIFLKSTLGYHMLKRNQSFLTIYLGYSVFVIFLMRLFFGWYAFVVGIAILLVDTLTMTLFEKRLLKKSFSEIMKGER